MFGNGSSHFTLAWAAASENFDGVRRHPNIKLLESGLEAFFEFDEELPALGQVHCIDKKSDQIVSVKFIFVTPHAADDLGFARDSTKVCFEFQQRVRDKFVRDRLPVVKLSRQEDFEPPK